MDLHWYITRMRDDGEGIVAMVDGIDEAAWRWRPASDAWSLLEVVNHLADEETDDFRTRLRMTLIDPGEPWPGIDPPAWVTDRGYQDRDPAESVSRFAAARAESLEWLGTLETPDWSATYQHLLLGDITAADLLTSWHAHDLLHLRQIVGLLFRYAESETGGGSAGYAGPW